MRKIIKWLDENFEATLIKVILAVTSVTIFAQVIARYVFDSSFYWSEEICRYLFVWMIYMGVSYAVKLDKHIKVDTLIALNILPLAGKKIITVISDIIFLVFALFIANIGFSVAALIARRNQITAATELPMWLVYIAVPLGYSLCIVRLIQRMVHYYKNRNADFNTFCNRKPEPVVVSGPCDAEPEGGAQA